MDSAILPSPNATTAALPGWLLPRGREPSELDAAFAAGAALKALDDLVRSEPAWAGCFRARQALKCASAAVRLIGRNEDEAAIRDAVLLTAAGDDPGPAGSIFLAYRKLSERKGVIGTKVLQEIADLLDLSWDDNLAAAADFYDTALQSGKAAPFAAADFVTMLHAARPDAETLGWLVADQVIAGKLNWARAVPLLMAERYGAAFRIQGGRGRVKPSEPGFPRAVSLAIVEGTGAALRSASDIARRADHLLAVVPKVRTKGSATVIRMLLDEDAVAASAPGANLSRWASMRFFDRLTTFDAIREFSGRASFRIYGL